MATRSPAQPPEEVYALQIRAEVLRTLSQANEVRRGHSDRLLLGSGDDPVERSVDTVAGSETVTIAGDLSETTGGSRSNSSSRQDLHIDGKLTLRGREETNILHGNMREMHHGRELLLSGMSDDMVGGLGIRTTAPVDLWLSALTGIEEKLGTAAADGALVEIAGMHMEREYGKGVHAYGAGVWTGAFYTHTATGFRPLLKMVRGVRNMTPGGGGGGGGSAAAAPPPAGAPPVATMPPFKFLKGVGKLGTNATPGDLIRLADLGEDARELQEVENARQMPGADVLKRVDDVAPDDARGVILLDDGTGTLAAHAADGADFDDPDWMRHLGGDAPPADDAARGTDVPDDFGNPSHLSAEVDRIRAAELAPLLDPTTRADEAAQSIEDKIRTLQRTAGTSQEKIRQYSLALELVKEGRNPVGVLDDVDAAADVSSILRYATPLPNPPTFADEIRPVAARPDGADDTGGEAFRPWADLIERREQADRFYQHKPETTGAKPSGLQLMGENHLQTTRIELRNMLEDLVRPLADDLGLDDARLTAMDTNMRGSDTALNLRRELVRAISEAKADSTDLNRVVIENGVVQINSASFIRWEPIEDASNIEAMQRMLDNWDAFATTQIAEAIEHADELADWDGIRLADNLDQGAFIDELRRLLAEEVAKYPEDVGSIPVEEVNVINAAVTTYGRAIGNAEAGYDPVPYIVETETWAKTFGGDGGLDKATAARVQADVRRNIVEALDNPAFKTGPDVAPTDQRTILMQAQTDAFHAGDFDQAWDLQKQIDQFDVEFDARYRANVGAANPATELGNDEAFEPWADLILRREQADLDYQRKATTTGAKQGALHLLAQNHLQTTRIELRNMLEDLVGPYADDLGLDDTRLTSMDIDTRGRDTKLNLRREFMRAISEAGAEGQIENSQTMQNILDNWDALARTEISRAIEYADGLADWDGIRLADNLDQGAFVDEMHRLQMAEMAKYPEDLDTITRAEAGAINAAATAYGRAAGNAQNGYDPIPYALENELWAKTNGGDGGLLDPETAARVNAEVRRNIVEALDNPAFKTGPDVAPTNQRAILTQAQIDAFHAGDFDQAWDLQKQIHEFDVEFDAQYRASVESDYADPADLIVREDGRPQPSRGALADRRAALAARSDSGTWPQSFNPNGADRPAVDDLPSAAPADLFDDPIYILPPAAKPDLFDNSLYARVELSRDAQVPHAAPARIRTTGADEIYSRVWSEPRVPTNSEGRFKADTGLRTQIRHNFYGNMGAHRAPLTDMQRKMQRWFGTDDFEDVVDTHRSADDGSYSGIGGETSTRADSGAADGYAEVDDYTAVDFTDDVDVDYNNVTDDADRHVVLLDNEDLPVMWLGGSFDEVLVAEEAAKPAADWFAEPITDIYRWEPPEGGRAGNRPHLDEDGASWSPNNGASGPDSPRPGEEVPPQPTNADSIHEPLGAAEPRDGPGSSQLIENPETTEPYATPDRTRLEADVHPSDYTRETLVTTTSVKVGDGPDGLPKMTGDGIPIVYISPNVQEVLERNLTILDVSDSLGNKLDEGDYVVKVEQSLATDEWAVAPVDITGAEMVELFEAAESRELVLRQWAATGGLLEDASARPVEVSELTRSLPGSSVDVASPPPARTDWTRMPLPGEEGLGESSGRFLGAGAGEADSTGLHRLDIASPVGELSPRPSSLDGRSSVDNLEGSHYPSAEELRITAAIEPESGGGRTPLPLDESIREALPGADVVPAAEDPSIRMVQSLNGVRRPFEPTDGAAVDEALGTWMEDAATAGGSDVRRADAVELARAFDPPLDVTFREPAKRPAPPPAPGQRATVNAGRKPIDLPFEERPPTLPPEVDATRVAQRLSDKIENLRHTSGTSPEKLRQYNLALSLVQEGLDPTHLLTDLDARSDMRLFYRPTPTRLEDIKKLPQAEQPIRMPRMQSSPEFIDEIESLSRTAPPLSRRVDQHLAMRKIADRIQDVETGFGATRNQQMLGVPVNRPQANIPAILRSRSAQLLEYNRALALVKMGLNPVGVIRDADIAAEVRRILLVRW